ncbi:hypothetical protein HI914_06832 [Erysiphe necator]|uniref:Uncharacterized protein n=1 Tax=Uncinula necator TaxID=52586 RepID=A0A0B1P463_UNCNE|nr:hypothetical protein HI914_06832 [Erysiphe necator]KHJ31706.1 hypothetical protein EV44_g2813 [Erysiphe necator]
MLSNSNSQKKCSTSKKQKPKSSSADGTSDDDSYAGVEQISDSEEDEPNVEKEEEREIIFSEDRNISLNTPQNILQDSWEGFSDFPDLADDMSLFGQNNLSEDKWCSRTEAPKDNESAEYVTAYGTRSVQFESSDDEFDMFDDLFPDIFVNKDHLDSSFRRQIDHDDVSEEGSYWEHDDVGSTYGIQCTNPYTVMEIPKNDEYEEYDLDSSSITGYESDISGETTDDDLPAEYYLQHRRTTVQIPEVESESEKDTHNSSPARTPRLYSWKHTSDKPFATVSSNCKKMILFNVHHFGNFGSSRSSQHLSGIQQAGQYNSSPLNANAKKSVPPGNLNTSLPEINTLMSTGLPSFYTPLTIDAGQGLIPYSSSCYDSDEFNDENCTEISPNLDEFINFESDESSFNVREPEPSNNTDVNNNVSTSSSKTNDEDQVHPLISHFNRGVVGSWRQKQNTHKLLHRNIVTPDSLAFGGNRFMEGTLKGVKSGRLKHANTPITPVRKQRPFSSLNIAADSNMTSTSTALKYYDMCGDEARTSKRRKIKM